MAASSKTIVVPVDELRRNTEAAGRALGLNAKDAAIAADHLIEADLWGRTSHGVSLRFSALERILRNPNREDAWRIHRDTGSCVMVDGGLWPGYVVATHCTDIAIRRAADRGVVVVAAFRTTHTGMLGYYVARAALAKRIALAFGDCCPLVVPAGAREKLLGTNPIAFGFPGPEHPIVADLSTSQMSAGALVVAQKEGRELPPGVIVDEEGNVTTDPRRRHGLAPLGGEKGTALCLAVQAVSALLAGAPPVPEPGLDYAFSIFVVDPEHLAGVESVMAGMKELLGRLHALPAAPGRQGARAPGERAFAEKVRRLKEGVPVEDDVWEHIRGLAEAELG